MKTESFDNLNALGLFPLRISPDSFLLYAPFAKKVMPCSCDEIRQMEIARLPLADKYVNLFDAKKKYESNIHPFSVKDISFMSILPTAACNFHCSYCYAGDMHNAACLSPAQILSGLTYLLSKRRTDRFGFSITLIGGGEPTLRPDLIEYAVVTAEELALKNEKGIDLTLVTNGSLITSDFAFFLKKHNVHIRVSFDILPDIQEMQRGCFSKVDAGLRTLREAECEFEIRTVVTPLNVGRLKETCVYLRGHYPFVKKLNLDPVISEAAFTCADDFRRFCQGFKLSFLEALKFCRESGISLDNVLMRILLGGPRRSYCPGEISLSPDGTLSICHQKSTRDECFGSGFSFGNIDRFGTISMDEVRLETMLNSNEEQHQCLGCFLQAVCRGGCKTLNAAYSEAFKGIYCEHNRALAKELLKLHIANNMEITT